MAHPQKKTNGEDRQKSDHIFPNGWSEAVAGHNFESPPPEILEAFPFYRGGRLRCERPNSGCEHYLPNLVIGKRGCNVRGGIADRFVTGESGLANVRITVTLGFIPPTLEEGVNVGRGALAVATVRIGFSGIRDIPERIGVG